MKPFKILCVDGGGIKGLYSAQVLAKFEEVFNSTLSDHFDLICGTSTGGIIALAASAKIKMADVVDFYDREGPIIFNQRFKINLPLRYVSGNSILSIRQAIFSSKYKGNVLEKSLRSVFKDMTLGQSYNLLCIPAYNITSATPRVFKKDYGNLTEDSNKSYVDVAMATAAAPTYLPVKEINNIEYVDGGLWANDPTYVGLAEFMFKHLKPIGDRLESDFDCVEVLSISSCEKCIGQISKNKHRSFFDWKDSLFDIYSNGQASFNEFFVKQLIPHLNFGVNITRVVHKPLSPEQHSLIDLDNASDESRKLLKAIGSETAANFKNNPNVSKFFQESKTIKF